MTLARRWPANCFYWTKMRWRRTLKSGKAKTALLVVVCYVLYAFVWGIVLQPKWPVTVMEGDPLYLDPPRNKSAPKKILFWTNFFLNKYGIMTHQDFIDTCPKEYSNCEITIDRSEVYRSDAVVFHAIDLMYDINLPSVRYPWQKYVFYLLEAPIRTYLDLTKWAGFFNYTMTFRHDSDAPKRFYSNKIPNTKPVVRNYAKGKTKMAVWFVSNCMTPSRREELAAALQKHIDVDIYGDCGALKCDVNGHRKCMEMAAKTYKFYLSFENSLCRDYVTEKFLYPLQYDIVPIVYSGANHSAVAPPHSFIDALEFSDAEQLAKFLLKVNASDELYNRYFDWKGQYEVVRGEEWCKLCQKLHTDTSPHQVYEDINKWWYEDGKCFTKPWVSAIESAGLSVKNGWKDLLSGTIHIVQNSGAIAKDIVGKH